MNYPFDLPAPVTHIDMMGPHMTKHHLANGQVLHHFTQPDTGDPHDHPFCFDSTILYGGYVEQEFVLLPDGGYTLEMHTRLPGNTHQVKATTIHRITRLLGTDCWTCITPGIKVREPGFYRFNNERIYRRDWNGEWVLFCETCPKIKMTV